MDITELDFSDIKTLEHLKVAIKDSNYRVVVYKIRVSPLYEALISDEYLVIDETYMTADYINYDFYIPTIKMMRTSIDKILIDLVGYDKNYILKNKVISITDVPYDYEEIFDVLCSTDGCFDKVDVGRGVFRQALTMHGFIESVGANGYYSSGTEKLKEFIANNSYSVIEILTGKSKDENDTILCENAMQKEIDTMYEIANKYGYSISKVKKI